MGERCATHDITRIASGRPLISPALVKSAGLSHPYLMKPFIPPGLSPVCVAAAFFVFAGRAVAQVPTDAPPVAVPGSCSSIDFNRATLESPVKVDLVVLVDDTGRPVSVAPLAEGANSQLLSAVIASAMSCKFQPAKIGGKPAAGSARLLYHFDKAQAAEPLGRRPSITDVQGCAPTAEDYPAASARLNETGTTRVRFTVDPTGRLTAFGVVRSSGFLRLDFTALIKLAGCKFQAATAADGTPTSASFEVEYVWKLK